MEHITVNILKQKVKSEGHTAKWELYDRYIHVATGNCEVIFNTDIF